MSQLSQTARILTVALTNLLQVATFDRNGTQTEWLRFDSAAAVAADVLVEASRTSEATIELALQLAGSLRALLPLAHPQPFADEAGLAKFERIQRDAGIALQHADLLPLDVHAHMETTIHRDDEEFSVIALTGNDEATFRATDSPGDIWAYVPADGPAGVEIAHRLARLSSQPIYGDSQQVGNALRASKALIEALISGEKRSEGDMRDVLTNFKGLALS